MPGYEKGFFVGPTIFDNVTEDMTVGRDEIFGPVLAIKRVEDFEEGITIMNASRFANGSCIFTESGYYAREFARRTHAGMVGINVGIPVPVSFFPFAGHKDSFFGESHVFGQDGIRFFTETKVRHLALVHRGRQEAEEGRHLGGHGQPVDTGTVRRRGISRAAPAETSAGPRISRGPALSVGVDGDRRGAVWQCGLLAEESAPAPDLQ